MYYTTEFSNKNFYLQWHQLDYRCKTLSCQKLNRLTLVTHTAQNRQHKEDHVRYHIKPQLLHTA